MFWPRFVVVTEVWCLMMRFARRPWSLFRDGSMRRDVIYFAWANERMRFVARVAVTVMKGRIQSISNNKELLLSSPPSLSASLNRGDESFVTATSC
jgi:hypothetical protein